MDYIRLDAEERARIGRGCSIHPTVALAKDRLQLAYGLIIWPEGYLEAAEDTFPNAKVTVLGGCMLGDAVIVEVVYCSECRLAEQRWRQVHPK